MPWWLRTLGSIGAIARAALRPGCKKQKPPCVAIGARGLLPCLHSETKFAIIEKSRGRTQRMKLRLAEKNELDEIFAPYAARVRWMDESGIHQWNETDYLARYPLAYYEKRQGLLYVLEDAPDGGILGAVVLLPEDERWDGQPDRRAWYVHNLVTKIGCPCKTHFRNAKHFSKFVTSHGRTESSAPTVLWQFSVRFVGDDAHIVPLGAVEFAENFRKNGCIPPGRCGHRPLRRYRKISEIPCSEAAQRAGSNASCPLQLLRFICTNTRPSGLF